MHFALNEPGYTQPIPHLICFFKKKEESLFLFLKNSIVINLELATRHAFKKLPLITS